MQKLNGCRLPTVFWTRLPPGRRAGGVLILVMAIVIAMSLLGAVLLSMGSANGGEMVQGQLATQAFWVAEGGISHAIARLRTDSSFRLNPTNFSCAVGTGVYSVTNAFDGTNYTMTSYGRVMNVRRTVRQSVRVLANSWPSAFADYALFGSAGTIDFAQGLNVSGSVFDYGNVSFAQNTTVSNGQVYATGAITGSGNFTVGTVPGDLPAIPVLDTTWYDSQISLAAASSSGAPFFPLNLNGGVLYVKGSLALGNITGSGTLVVSGDVSLSQDISVASGFTLVSGGALNLAQACSTGSNTIFYARNGITMDKDNIMLSSCSLITPGSITAKKTFQMSGAIYAGGTITIQKDATVYGSIVGGSGITAQKDINVFHDVSYLPPTLPPGFTSNLSIVSVHWDDVGAASF